MGKEKKVIEDRAEKKKMRFLRGSHIMIKINGATIKIVSSGVNSGVNLPVMAVREAWARRVLRTFPQLTNVTIFLDSGN